MPDVVMNNQELNDHVNENSKTQKHPLTECRHEVPYGPARGKEDPAHGPGVK